MMGFLYNPHLLTISPQEDTAHIFKKAKNNYVILVDDPAENANLLRLTNLSENKTETKLTYTNLKELTQNTTVYITNDFNKIYNINNFAFSFLWSGDALLYLKNSKSDYKFTLHTGVSYICTDLLAQIKMNSAAKCVAQELSSPEMENIVQQSTYYFTPYFKNNIKDENFNSLYVQTAAMLDNMNWIQPMTYKQFSSVANQWEDIKIKINAEKNK